MASITTAHLRATADATISTQETQTMTAPLCRPQVISSRRQFADTSKPRKPGYRGSAPTVWKKRATVAALFSSCIVVMLSADQLFFGGGILGHGIFDNWVGWLTSLASELSVADYVVGSSFAALISWKVCFSGTPQKPNQTRSRANGFTASTSSSETKVQSVGVNGAGQQSPAKQRNMSGDGSAVGSNGRWNQAIDTAARQGDFQKAGQLLLELEKAGQPDVVSYNLVIRACAKKGNVKEAEKWLMRMETRGIEATSCSYNTLLDACAKADQAEMCESWLEHMLKKNIDANVISYATAIYARARRGDVDIAERWFQRMVDAGVQPDVVSYNSLIHAHGVKGNAMGAQKWIEHMQARGFAATVTTYTAVIDACAKSGDITLAEKWLNQMIADNVEPNVVSFCALIDACAKGSDLARAEFWHDKMSERGIIPNAHSYSAVINACAKSGNVDAAERWLTKSEQTGIANDVVVYSGVIDACGKAGDPERAMATFRRMQAHGIRPHIVAYAGLARPFAYQGDWVKVESIAQEMRTQGISPNEYFLYAQLLAYSTSRPKQGDRAEQCFRRALAVGVNANDHVVGVLARAVGRSRCQELMRELCNSREVPMQSQRRSDNNAPANRSGRPGTR